MRSDNVGCDFASASYLAEATTPVNHDESLDPVGAVTHFQRAMMMDVDQAAKAMKEAEIEDEIETSLKASISPLTGVCGSMRSEWQPGTASTARVRCKTDDGIHDVTARSRRRRSLALLVRSATDLFARSRKLFLQQRGPHLGRLAPCLPLHWRKNAIPECLSVFFPALATVGDAHEEMVGGMVDEA
jgi:hypothetical protein